MLLYLRCKPSFRTATFVIFIISGAVDGSLGKPTGETLPSASSDPDLPGGSSAHLPTYTPSAQPTSSRRLIASRTDDGFWSANARLPTSVYSGGNDNSRYKIRRDGSLSLALKLPPPRDGHISSGLSPKLVSSRVAPTELRSFSVVLSDVDVVGRYDRPAPSAERNDTSSGSIDDLYADAGVSMYKLQSNSIHRMNASWKLNPSNSSPTSEDLLQFLSLFSSSPSSSSSANEEERAHLSSGSEDNASPSNANYSLTRIPLTKYSSPLTPAASSSGAHLTVNKLSEEIRGAVSGMRSEKNDAVVDNNDDAATVVSPTESDSAGGRGTNSDGGSESNGAASGVVLHDLISTLGKLNNNNVNRGNGTTYLDTDGGASLKEEQRMKPADPQQTAADLKRLMGLFFSAQTLTNTTGPNHYQNPQDQVRVVNVVIGPSDIKGGNEPLQTNKGQSNFSAQNQKMIFLKPPQVKRLLDSAFNDPMMSLAAEKIAAALDSDHDPMNNHIDPMEPTASPNAIPTGFPISAPGYLNIHHPNLQFHQALHHLIANGTAPLRINTTVKTNVINVFVLNFNNGHDQRQGESSHKSSTTDQPVSIQKKEQIGGHEQEHAQLQSMTSTTTKTAEQSPTELPLSNFKPILIEKLQDSPLVFYNKIGVLSAPFSPPPPSGHQIEPITLTPSENTTIPSHDHVKSENDRDRVNILELLPADLNAFKKVTYEAEPDLASQAEKIVYTLTQDGSLEDAFQGSHNISDHLDDDIKAKPLDNTNPHYVPVPSQHGIPHVDSDDYIPDMQSHSTGHHHHGHGHIMNLTESSSKPIRVYVKTPHVSHTSWILHHPHHHHHQEPENKDKAPDTSLPDYDDPDFPEENISYGGKPPEGSNTVNPFFQLYDDSPLPTTTEGEDIMASTSKDEEEDDEKEETSTPRIRKKPAFYAIRNNHTDKDPFLLLLGTHPALSSRPTMGNSSNDHTDNDSNYNQQQNQIALSAGVNNPPGVTSPPATSTNGGGGGGGNILRNRVRKFLTALGYSALPTLAAGAAATWSYWVPLVATAASGKKRRRKRFSFSPYVTNTSGGAGVESKDFPRGHALLQNKLEAVKKAIELGKSEQSLPQSFDVNALSGRTKREPKSFQTDTNSSSSTSPSPSSPNIFSSSTPPSFSHVSKMEVRSNFPILKNTGDDQDNEEDESKWIRVEIITESSPTLRRRHQHHQHHHRPNKIKAHYLSHHEHLHLSTPPAANNRPITLEASDSPRNESWTKTDLDVTTTTTTTMRRDVDNDRANTTGGSEGLLQPRHHRRLTKWEKAANDGVGEGGNDAMDDQDEGSLLYQSLKAMETHLLDKPDDEFLESSSEKDVYLQDGGGNLGGAEQDSDEDDDNAHDEDDEEEKANFLGDNKTAGGVGSDSHGDITKEKNDALISTMKLQQLKHQQQLQQQEQETTTPKGLTTWSAVGANSAPPPRGTVQKISDFTVSSGLAFSTQGPTTNKPITTADIVTKDKVVEVAMTMAPTPLTTTTTTEPPRKTNLNTPGVIPSRPLRRKPVHQKKPPKYVKPSLDEVTATIISSDDTHNTYVLKPVEDPEAKTSTPDLMASYTKQPWPFMTTKKTPFMKIRTTARPIKSAYAKRTQTPKLSLTTPTTSKPSTTTVYYRNPASNFVHPIIPISFTNLSFMDYIRTQIVPKLGLTMISFIATSPLILSMLGAVGRRRKRDLSSNPKTGTQDLKFSEILDTLATKWEQQLESRGTFEIAQKKPNKRGKVKTKYQKY